MVDFTSQFGRAVQQHIKDQYVIWMTTVDSNLTPQPRPVWFIWENDSFLIFSQPNAHKVKHILKNPRVALHFNTDETGDRHVMIFIGEAFIDTTSPFAHEIPEYFKKYQEGIATLDMTPEEFGRDYSTAIRIKPAEVRGWE